MQNKRALFTYALGVILLRLMALSRQCTLGKEESWIAHGGKFSVKTTFFLNEKLSITISNPI